MTIDSTAGLFTKAQFNTVAMSAGLTNVKYTANEAKGTLTASADVNDNGSIYKAVTLLAYHLVDDALAGEVREGSKPTVVDTEDLLDAVACVEKYVYNDYGNVMFYELPIKEG